MFQISYDVDNDDEYDYVNNDVDESKIKVVIMKISAVTMGRNLSGEEKESFRDRET